MSNATDSPRKDNSNLNECHTVPIPILGAPHRRRSSTVSSDGSPTTPPDIQTSISYPTKPVSSSPTSSPIFSYFMSSPPKTATFPYRRLPGLNTGVFEDDEGEIEAPSSPHQRRATTSWGSSRVASQKVTPAPPVIEAQQARGAGVLRRLSLGGGFGPFIQSNTNRPPSPPEPATPPPSAVASPVASGFAASQTTSQRKVRRAATLSVPSSNARRRAPSPMGERILKGHFDGFN